jgi:N-acyl amino acid synthase of PEP-CTERM/exosortase system
MDNLQQHFSKYFYPKIANTNELKREAFGIRHQVYCEELGFEPLKADGQEKDDFDDRSIHLLLQHIGSQKYAGNVRLVCSSSEDELLPIEKYCLDSFYADGIKPSQFPRHKLCEISRLAVPVDFRRRSMDKYEGSEQGGINTEIYSETELRCFPFIAVGLYLEIVAVAKRKGIEHFFVMMEPRLARSTAFVGIKWQQVGDVVEYHGKRAAYYINLDMFYKTISPSFLTMLEYLEKELHSQSV